MTRALGWLVALAIVLAAAAGVAAWLLPTQLDPVRVRDALQTAAAQRLGATVTIDGPVTFALLPRPILAAARVSLLHGTPGDADAIAITADSLTVRLDLHALLAGRFAAGSLVLRGAEITAPLPFDIAALSAGRPKPLLTTSVILEHSRIRAGSLVIQDVDAAAWSDRDTGDLTLAGTFRVADSAWRTRILLTRPGGDGSAALNASLDEIYASDGMTASFSGQIARDGGVAGKLTAAGPSLARLGPAPAVAFQLSGRATLAGGVLDIADAALTLQNVAGRLDAAATLAPRPHVDVRLATARLDLDAWWRAWAFGTPGSAVPASVEITAEAASAAGGIVRKLHVLADADRTVSIRALDAILPGEMHVAGTGLISSASIWQMDVAVDGDDARTTAAWLMPQPDNPFRTLATRLRAISGHATLGATQGDVEIHRFTGMVDGVAVTGDGDLTLAAPGGRAKLAAIVSIDRLDLPTPGTSWAALAGASQLPLDAVLRMTAVHASMDGLEATPLQMELTAQDGTLDISRLAASAADWQFQAHGTRTAEGRWSDVSAAAQGARLDRLAPWLSATWRERLGVRPGLAAQPWRVSVTAAGNQDEAAGTLVADIGELRVNAAPVLAAEGLRTQISLRHPDARALARIVGVPLDFLGPGGLAASAALSRTRGVIAADDLSVQAGTLDAFGALRLDVAQTPELTGHIAAGVLPVPALQLRDATPLPLDALRGWSGRIDVTASEVSGLPLRVSDLRGTAALHDDAATLDLSAHMADGIVAGALALDAAQVPPRASAALTLAGATLVAPASPRLGAAGKLSADVRLSGEGFSAAALLATLTGRATARLEGGRLDGLDAGEFGDLSDAAVRHALAGGHTDLASATLSLALDHGLGQVTAEAGASGGSRLRAAGSLDVSAATVDLGLDILPSMSDPPAIGLRVTGRLEAPDVTPALGALARWRAQLSARIP